MRGWLRFFDAAFGRYAATSALATVTDFALASSLHSAGGGAAASTFFGCVAGGGVAFWLSRSWTFQAGAGRAWPQVLRFLFVWATSALLNSTGVPALLGWVGSFPLAWTLVRASVYLGWNYPLSRWFVFAAEKPDTELSAP
ncbi:MAG TPA: GtrA family protein [Polyangiaceae bacterium]|nr:GtrA family protein [Polyangiaceae bacterium]